MKPYIKLIIGTALDNNFVFASLDDAEKKNLSNSMDKVQVPQGDDLITQGEYFWYLYYKR